MATIAFCQDILVEYMGFMSMAAVLKQHGHQVEVFYDDQTDRTRFLDQLKAFAPDIICFSLLSPSVKWALDVSKDIKRHLNSLVIYGNVAAILDPSLLEHQGVDIICLGEGEYSLLELATRIDQHRDYTDIPSFMVKTSNGIFNNPLAPLIDLDALPFLDRSIYDKFSFFKSSPYLRLYLGRGCPFHCTFCTNATLKSNYGTNGYVRKMSPERAIKEIEFHVRKYRPRYLMFIDEVLWVSNKWLREFLPLYRKQINLKYVANFRWGNIEESDIKLLADSGADCLILATETGDESQRINLFKKNVTDAQIYNIAELLQKYKIKFCVSQFFGIPTDTFEGHIKQLAFYRRLNATYLWTTFYQPYPGTELASHEIIKKAIPEGKDFGLTLHSDIYLTMPNRQRWINLKKVYFLMAKFPSLEKPLLKLTKYKIPLFFDLLFFLHFTYYAITFEKVSLSQLAHHFNQFYLRPIIGKLKAFFTKPQPSA